LNAYSHETGFYTDSRPGKSNKRHEVCRFDFASHLSRADLDLAQIRIPRILNFREQVSETIRFILSVQRCGILVATSLHGKRFVRPSFSA